MQKRGKRAKNKRKRSEEDRDRDKEIQLPKRKSRQKIRDSNFGKQMQMDESKCTEGIRY